MEKLEYSGAGARQDRGGSGHGFSVAIPFVIDPEADKSGHCRYIFAAPTHNREPTEGSPLVRLTKLQMSNRPEVRVTDSCVLRLSNGQGID